MAHAHRPEIIPIGHGGPVVSLAFSSDGDTLVSGSYDETMIIWDVRTGKMLRLLRAEDYINGQVIAPDGRTTITEDGRVWESPDSVPSRRTRRRSHQMECATDGRTLAAVYCISETGEYQIRVFDARTGRTKRIFACGNFSPHALAFSADNELVGVNGFIFQTNTDSSMATLVCNVRTGEVRQVLKDLRSLPMLVGVDFAPNVRLVGIAQDGSQLWNAETGQWLQSVVDTDWMRSNTRNLLESITLSPSGRLLVTNGRDGIISLWEVTSSRCIWYAQAHQSWCRTSVFAPENKILATAGGDHLVRLWDVATGQLLHTLGRPRISVEAIAFHGHTLTALGEDGSARWWGVRDACLFREEPGPVGLLTRSAPKSPDTARHLWDLAVDTLPLTIENEAGGAPTFYEKPPDATNMPHGADQSFTIDGVSPNGSLIAMRGHDDSLFIWNRQSQSLQCILKGAASQYATPTFSPDNRFLAVSSDYNFFRIFDLLKGELWQQPVCKLEERIDTACTFVFSPDSKTLAAGHWGFAVSLWDAKTGVKKQRLEASMDTTVALAFSPDGKTLAVGSTYENIAWQVPLNQRRKQMALIGHMDGLRAAAYSPEGTRLATGGQDGTVRLWDTADGTLLATYLALPDGEWIVYTPKGEYSGSEGAAQFFLWRQGADLLSPGAFESRPPVPDTLLPNTSSRTE